MISKKYILFFILIIVLVILSLSFPTKCFNKEHFDTYYGYYKQFCPTCGWRSRSSCGKCTNCGVCVKEDGSAECVPGDSNGPYFDADCIAWEYGDPYYYYPYSHIYPVVKIRSIYPFDRWKVDRKKMRPLS